MEEQYIDTSVRYEVALKTKSIIESMCEDTPRLKRPNTFDALDLYLNVEKPQDYDIKMKHRILRNDIVKKSDVFLRKEIAPIIAISSNKKLDRVEPYFHSLETQSNYCRAIRIDKDNKQSKLCMSMEKYDSKCGMCKNAKIPKHTRGVLPPPVYSNKNYDKCLEGKDVLVGINLT